LVAPLALVAWLSIARAQEAAGIVVRADHAVPAGCRVALDRDTTALQSARATDELLRAIPGVGMTSALGYGGAWSYTLRGLEAGHGRDLAVTLENVPLNQPSHLGGPGYVDLTFLPRPLLESVDGCVGVAGPDVGAFTFGGESRLRIGLPREGGALRLGAGTDGSGSLSLAYRPRGWGDGTFAVAEVDGGEGVAGYRSWRHLRLAGGVEGNAGPVNASATLLLYDGQWDLPTFLRTEDVEEGRVRFLGGYRGWEGQGASRRLLVMGRLARPWEWGGLRLDAWFGMQGFRARDNRTGLLLDPVYGDATEGRQDSSEVGIKAMMGRNIPLWGDVSRVDGGIELRSVFHRQRDRRIALDFTPGDPLSERRVQHGTIAGWARYRLAWNQKLTLTAAVRVEEVDLRVRDGVDPVPAGDAPRTVGWMVSPSAVLRVRPSPRSSVEFAYFRGFRSPDGREDLATGLVPLSFVDTVQAGVDAEVGARLALRVGAWAAFSPDEVSYQPWTGARLGSAPTRRIGGEARVGVAIVPGLSVELDGQGTDARQLLGAGWGTPVPWSVPGQVGFGAVAQRLRAGPVQVSGSVRGFWLAGRPMGAGDVSHAAFGADLLGRVHWRAWSFDARIDNVIPVRRRDAEDVFASSWTLDGTGSAAPVRHQIGGEPFVVTLGVGASF
jgi:hypothetical protein